MNREDIEFAPKDVGLRDDVSMLGALVGDMLREQGGAALFDRVESVRQAAIRRRTGDARAAGALNELLNELPAQDAQGLVRAFAAYFQVVNLAERVHRIRRRRDYEREGGGPQPDGLADALTKLKSAGVTPAQLAELLADLLIEPVFTAHPTEATRRTLLEKQQRIARSLIARLDAGLTPGEDAALCARIRAEITSSWQTEEHPAARMSVANEREHVLFYLTEVLYRVLPVFYETLEQALSHIYGDKAGFDMRNTLVRFGSWVGGDMDGNPNVTADTIRETLRDQRSQIFDAYDAELCGLYRQLSQSESRVGASAALRERIAEYRALMPQVYAKIPPRHHDMPYRMLLHGVRARLREVQSGDDAAYEDAAGLSDDLQLIAASLRANQGAHAGLFNIMRLLRRVDAFGFHLATLDVRQDSLVHRTAVGQLLAIADWEALPPTERAGRLRRTLENFDPPRKEPDPTSRAVLDVFAAIGEGRARYGRQAVGPYIISMAQDADDVLSVLLLARWGGLRDAAGNVPLDVAPLFETVDDLQRSAAVMRTLLDDPVYRAHLAARADRQFVMVGYSDSNKDGGLAAARWALQQAQSELVTTLDTAGVALTIFHGRGGTTSRGGGKTHRAVVASPPGAVRGRLRLTEQGEIINAKYGLRAIALRTLEQMSGAVMLATLTPAPSHENEPAWRAVMETVARESRAVFRRLVYQSDGFETFFRQATPIDVIERLQIGSRPAARRGRTGIVNLRAIPWVFAWTQSRYVLTGWYGLGAGLTAALKKHGDDILQEMQAGWPFFGNLVDDAEMVLAKADLPIAARYAELAEPGVRHFFDTIRSEYEATVATVLRIKRSDALLAQDPTLQRSIRLRNPYVDPMSLLQVDLLRRWRATDRQDDDLLHALFTTVKGIAQGLQNTG